MCPENKGPSKLDFYLPFSNCSSLFQSSHPVFHTHWQPLALTRVLQLLITTPLTHNANPSDEFWALCDHPCIAAAAVLLHNWPICRGDHGFPLKWFSYKSHLLLITPDKWLPAVQGSYFQLLVGIGKYTFLPVNMLTNISSMGHWFKHGLLFPAAPVPATAPLLAAPSHILPATTLLSQLWLPAAHYSKH